MFENLFQAIPPKVVAAVTGASGTVGALAWADQITGIIGFYTVIVAAIGATAGLIYCVLGIILRWRRFRGGQSED